MTAMSFASSPGGSPDTDFAIGALRRCALFTAVDDQTLELCASTLRVRRYRKNETIFHQGDPGDSLYIIESGSVKIVLPSPEGEEGAIIATLGRGDFFGELALLDGAPHSATAVAIETAEAMVLRRDRFDDLVETQPQLRRALFSGLVAELRRLTGHVEELHFLDLPGRLAIRIVRLAREAHPDETKDIRLDWPFTQSDLAAMIGGTRQTVNRLLADMTAQDLVRLERDTLIIPDLDRLARAAER
jgi:CRP-like cAMP-binding protein